MAPPQPATPTTDVDVIVIGAGPAGLAATQSLTDHGRSVLCLEAWHRIGGRVHTNTSHFGVPFDEGAHWLHLSEVNPFVHIGQSLGLDMYPSPRRGHTQGDDPSGTLLWQEADRFEAALEAAAEAGLDIAASELFESRNDWSATGAMMECLAMGRDMHDISVQDWASFADGTDWFCRQGYGTLLAKHSQNVPVTLRQPVTGITAGKGGVHVHTHSGSRTARAVIVTVSQGVLAAEHIRFDPPLPNDRLGAIEAIDMGTYNHTSLLFTPGTIPVEEDTWVTYRVDEIKHGAIQGGGFLCNVGGTALCNFSTSGGFARDLETAGQDAAIDYALGKLSEIFGAHIRKSFVKGYATQWGRHPYTLGSYAGARPGKAHLRQTLRHAHADRVFFAGEATSHDEQATVSGAHKEGLRAATEVMRLLA